MKHVSSCLRQHYPNTYEQFLRSMFDLNEDKIGASQCLEQIRLSLCEFPPLVDQFERLYNTLVNSNVGKNDDYDKKRKIPAIDCTQENNAENDTYSPTADKQTWKRARLYCDAKAYQEHSDGSSQLSNSDNLIDGSRIRKANLVAKKTVMLPGSAEYSSNSSSDDIDSASSDGDTDNANSDDDIPTRNFFGPDESVAVEETAVQKAVLELSNDRLSDSDVFDEAFCSSHKRLPIFPIANKDLYSVETKEIRDRKTASSKQMRQHVDHTALKQLFEKIKVLQFQDLSAAGPITMFLRRTKGAQIGNEESTHTIASTSTGHCVPHDQNLRKTLFARLESCMNALFRLDLKGVLCDNSQNNDKNNSKLLSQEKMATIGSNLSQQLVERFSSLKLLFKQYHDREICENLLKVEQAKTTKYIAYAKVRNISKRRDWNIKIEDTRDVSCQLVKSVAKYLSHKLRKPIASRKHKFAPYVSTKILYGRGAGYREAYVHNAIACPIFPPNPISSSFVTVADNFYKEDENVLRFIPYFSDKELEEVLDVEAYDVLPGQALKGLDHEVDDYIAVITAFAITRNLQHAQSTIKGKTSKFRTKKNVSKTPDASEDKDLNSFCIPEFKYDLCDFRDIPKFVFEIVGLLTGEQLEHNIVHDRVEKLVFKDHGKNFAGTGVYEWLDKWSNKIKHKSLCQKYIERRAISIELWKKHLYNRKDFAKKSERNSTFVCLELYSLRTATAGSGHNTVKVRISKKQGYIFQCACCQIEFDTI